MHNPLKILIALLFFLSLGRISELFSQQDSLYVKELYVKKLANKELYVKEKSRGIVSEDTEFNNDTMDEEPLVLNLGEVRQLIGYPNEAIRLGIECDVKARLLVNKKGNYVRHIIIEGKYPVFVEAVEKHLPKLRFTPAILKGKPTPFWVDVPFIFRLED